MRIPPEAIPRRCGEKNIQKARDMELSGSEATPETLSAALASDSLPLVEFLLSETSVLEDCQAKDFFGFLKTESIGVARKAIDLLDERHPGWSKLLSFNEGSDLWCAAARVIVSGNRPMKALFVQRGIWPFGEVEPKRLSSGVLS